MTCSHCSVETGGNSSSRFSPAAVLVLMGIFHDLNQDSKWAFGARLGVNEENCVTARSGPRRFVDDLKALGLHVIEGLLRIPHPKGNMRQPTAPTVLIDELLNRRVRAQRLQQLDQVGTVADTQQRFANLITAVHLFTMNLLETQQFVGFDLGVEFALLHRDGHVIDKPKAYDRYNLLRQLSHVSLLSKFGSRAKALK